MMLTGASVVTLSVSCLIGLGHRDSVEAIEPATWQTSEPIAVEVAKNVSEETPAYIQWNGTEQTIEPAVKLPYTEEEVAILCKTVYGEALVTNSDEEMSAVVWCILNRVDDEDSYYADTISGVVTKSQFHGYDEDHPVTEHIEWLVRDVLDRWVAEKNGETDVGRTLPSEYLFFSGDGWHNHFRTEWDGGARYDWSLPNPYES